MPYSTPIKNMHIACILCCRFCTRHCKAIDQQRTVAQILCVMIQTQRCIFHSQLTVWLLSLLMILMPASLAHLKPTMAIICRVPTNV